MLYGNDIIERIARGPGMFSGLLPVARALFPRDFPGAARPGPDCDNNVPFSFGELEWTL